MISFIRKDSHLTLFGRQDLFILRTLRGAETKSVSENISSFFGERLIVSVPPNFAPWQSILHTTKFDYGFLSTRMHYHMRRVSGGGVSVTCPVRLSSQCALLFSS